MLWRLVRFLLTECPPMHLLPLVPSPTQWIALPQRVEFLLGSWLALRGNPKMTHVLLRRLSLCCALARLISFTSLTTFALALPAARFGALLLHHLLGRCHLLGLGLCWLARSLMALLILLEWWRGR